MIGSIPLENHLTVASKISTESNFNRGSISLTEVKAPRCCEGKIKARYLLDESSTKTLDGLYLECSHCRIDSNVSLESGDLVLLDSLRWGMYDAGTRLLGLGRSGEGYFLQLTTSSGRRYSGVDKAVISETTTKAIRAPFSSVNPTTLRNKIASEASPFGLLAIVETTYEKTRLTGYNENGRQVVTIERLVFKGANSAVFEIFGDDAASVDELASKLSQELPEIKLSDTINLIASLAKRRAGDFSTSFEIGSNKKLNDALFDLLKRSMPSLKIAYDAVLQEVDEESLHDLRVIARSIKSIFAAAARYVANEDIDQFLEAVANLITVTTTHRDIDVAIEYLSQFPQFEGACEVLEERRRNLTESFLSDLESAIEAVTATWKIAAARLVITSSRDAISVEDFYEKEANRVHEKILAAIDKSGGAKGLSIDELHTLRKRFKKLRYLTETFHRDASSDPLAITSKSFQTSLGLLQDCQVLLDLLLDIEEQAGQWSQSVEAAIVHSQERLESAKVESLAKLSQLVRPSQAPKSDATKGKSGTTSSKRMGKIK